MIVKLKVAIISQPKKLLEQILYDECIKLGVNIIIDDDWKKHIDNTDILFLATGNYNAIAEELINTKYILKTTYYGMCMFFTPDKYKEYTSTNNNIKPKIKSNRYRIFPVRKNNQMYIGTSLSKTEYDLLNKSSKILKENNQEINIDTVPDKIKTIVKNGLNYYNFKNITNSKIFPVEFGIKYNSKIIENITYKNKKILVCLIGNQAYNHHFFAGRGIIAGFNGCYYLNKLISANYKNGYQNLGNIIYLKVTKARIHWLDHLHLA